MSKVDLLAPRWKVYTLADPISKQVTYVGCTMRRLSTRLAQHCNTTFLNSNKNKPKLGWIAELRKIGLRPKIETIEEFENEKDAMISERYWIDQFRQWGFSLYNIYEGKKMSAASKIKLGLLKAGRPVQPHVLLASNEARRKGVIQLDKNGTPIKSWRFIIEASRELGIDRGDIGKCCKGRHKTAGGFCWVYETNYLKTKNTN